jgi:hypothetical protein
MTMRLTYACCDDWLIYARADDGSWWSTITETWPEWLDAASDAGIDPDDWEAVDDLATAPNAVEQHMVPRVTAWDSNLSPTASAVSAPTDAGLQGATAGDAQGVVGFAAWTRVPDSDVADLEALAARRR